MQSRPPEQGSTPTPRLIALLVCERIDPDDAGKKSIVGVHESTFCTTFPASKRILIYVRYADIAEGSRLSLRLAEQHGGRDFGGIDLVRTETVPFGNYEWTVTYDAVFEGEGLYEFRFLVNDVLIGWTRYNVRHLPL